MNDTTVTSTEPHSHPSTPALNSVRTAKQKLLRRPPPRQKKLVDYDRRLNAVIDNYDDYDRLDLLKCVGTIK